MAQVNPVINYNGIMGNMKSTDTLAVPMVAQDIENMSNANAAAITQGQAVYISGADSVNLAVASALGTARTIGLVFDASIAAAAVGRIITYGNINLGTWLTITGSAALTPGSLYYVDPTTAGKLTTVAPTASGSYQAPIGIAIDTTTLKVDTSVGPFFAN